MIAGDINYKELLFGAREALVVVLSFYEDLTDKKATPTFIADYKKLLEFSKNYDIEFVYAVYEKIKNLKK